MQTVRANGHIGASSNQLDNRTVWVGTWVELELAEILDNRGQEEAQAPLSSMAPSNEGALEAVEQFQVLYTRTETRHWRGKLNPGKYSPLAPDWENRCDNLEFPKLGNPRHLGLYPPKGRLVTAMISWSIWA